MAELQVERDPVPQVQDTALLRRTFGSFATGVTVVTTGGDEPHGMTANSFTAVSLVPPLVLVCVDRNANMHSAMVRAGAFGVSVLSAGQERVARHFAGRRPMGAAEFTGTDCLSGAWCGAPLIAGAAAHFECELWRTYDGGDHTIFVGRLLSMAGSSDEDVLIFLRGQFGRLESDAAGRRAA
ncbi:flavin reductase family protein [Micromonospora sp. NPDC006766]|uniref:flavin reductase family protein n=1 Tax=Micromonospora sp. NPDC006766 TaxID=3154778 RepID=UPI0033ECBD0F